MAERSNIEARIAYDDLREWLTRAELLGEVRSVKGASWQEDIGLAAEAILRAEDGPCVVFDAWCRSFRKMFRYGMSSAAPSEMISGGRSSAISGSGSCATLRQGSGATCPRAWPKAIT